jgi:SagB-type dehydrogenase family enzyme
MNTSTVELQSDTVPLPAPELGAVATTLDQALRLRHSERHFMPDALPLQTLSSLLWAANGINRPGASDGRTAPSAHNWQETEVYVVVAEGAFRYEARSHRLLRVQAHDVRGLTGLQDFPADAPLNLVYVANYKRMIDAEPDDCAFLAGVAAGCIAQNVYLACAAHGLGTVVRALIDRRRLAAALGLELSQHILLAQTVGWPLLK